MACSQVGALVEQSAKPRDTGVTEQSQHANIENPNGTLAQLSIRSRLSADTAGTLRAELHRQINYVHAPREMTPAQLGARARETCENPENVGTPVAPPAVTRLSAVSYAKRRGKARLNDTADSASRRRPRGVRQEANALISCERDVL